MAEESSAITAAAAAAAAAQEAARQIASEPGFSIAGCGGPTYTFEVCEPRQCGEGLGSFITYIVRSTSDLGSFSVTRRFSDFAWLREQLQRVYPGCVIMGLPPKTFKWTSNILADDFVQKRGRALQHFLEGTAQHAELRASSHFETFMQADAEDLVAAKARTKASGGDGADGGAVGGEIGGAMGRLFGRLGRALSSTAAAPSSGGMLGGGGGAEADGADGGGAGALEGAGMAESAEAAAAGRAVYLFKRFAEELSTGAKLLQARAAALPGAGAATGTALTALAQAVGGVGLVEGGHVAIAVGATHIQQALSQQAAHAGALGAEFAEGVERFVGLVAAVEEALRARDGAAEERALARSSRNRLRGRAAAGDLVGPELDAAEATAVHEESRFAKVQARALRDVGAFKEQYQPALKALLLQLLRAEEEALSERQELLRSVIGAVEGAQPSHPPPMQPASPRAAAAAAPAPAEEEAGGASPAPAAPVGGGAIDFSLDSGPGL
jgi:hypothetical protein